MGSFHQFLQQFKQQIEQEVIQVSYSTGRHTACAQEVFIGIGQEEEKGIVLNNKVSVQKPVSVTQHLMDSEAEEQERWKEKITLRDTCFFVEDFSPDTCFAFLVLFARMEGVQADTIPVEWIKYVNRWESGDVKTTGDTHQSWGALLNALSHEYLRISDSGENQEYFREGFYMCLSFTIDLLLEKVHPAQIPEIDGSPACHRARAILNIELQEYHQLLSNAETIQLRLPLQRSDRKTLVDALIVTELAPMGTLKNFARADTRHSFFKTGFGLMVLHRPHLTGTGEDIVLSVDPGAGVHLEDAWTGLENLESQRWHGKRPDDKKRYGYQVNQPWFLNNDRTLLAAPRMVETGEGKEPGTRLEWEDVLKELWQAYSPVKDLQVHPYIDNQWGNPCTLSEAFSAVRGNGKRFIALKWAAANEEQAMILTPTIKRYLVACLQDSEREPGISNLPAENSFTFLDLPSGFACIHEKGVVFFDDWSKEKSRVVLYSDEFRHLYTRFLALKKFQSLVKSEADQIKHKLKNKKRIRRDLVMLSDNLGQLKIDLQDQILQTMATSNDYHLSVFRESMEKQWGLNTQLDHLYHSINEIESTIKNVAETRANRVLSGITIFGFPFVLFGSIFQQPLYNLVTLQSYDVEALLSFSILVCSLVLFLKHWVDGK